MTISRKSSRGSQSLLASGSSCYKFPFRFVVKSEMPSMLVQHFDLWSGDHLPLVSFVQHSSMFVEHGWHLRLNRENLKRSTQSPVFFVRNTATDVAFSNRRPLRVELLVFYSSLLSFTRPRNRSATSRKGKLPSSLSFQTSFPGRPPTVRFITICSNGTW